MTHPKSQSPGHSKIVKQNKKKFGLKVKQTENCKSKYCVPNMSQGETKRESGDNLFFKYTQNLVQLYCLSLNMVNKFC